MGGARMIGSSISLAVSSWLMSTYNYSVAVFALAIIIGLITLVPILLREEKGEKLLPWSSGVASVVTKQTQLTNWSKIFTSLYGLFRLKNSMLVSLLMFVSMGAYNYFETLLPLFAVKVSGWTNVSYSQAFATADLIGGIGGILLGGYLIERFGKKRMITIYFGMIICLTLVLIVAKTYWTNSPFIYGFIIVYRWFNAFAKIGVYAVAMACCSRVVSASQFTFYMTIGAVGSMFGATLIGPMKGRFDWDVTFGLFILLLLVAAVVLSRINIRQQITRITELEREEKRMQAHRI
jgi:PAT family beta-lactamase induction signal transducer AmpG